MANVQITPIQAFDNAGLVSLNNTLNNLKNVLANVNFQNMNGIIDTITSPIQPGSGSSPAYLIDETGARWFKDGYTAILIDATNPQIKISNDTAFATVYKPGGIFMTAPMVRVLQANFNWNNASSSYFIKSMDVSIGATHYLEGFDFIYSKTTGEVVKKKGSAMPVTGLTLTYTVYNSGVETQYIENTISLIAAERAAAIITDDMSLDASFIKNLVIGTAEIGELTVTPGKFSVGNLTGNINPATDKLFHFDKDLNSTQNLIPNAGYVATLRPNEGKYGGAVAVDPTTTNMIALAKQKFVGWTADGGATVTLTQNQSVSEWGATDATRIQTSGGTSVQVYYLSLTAPTVGTPQTYSIKIKNTGTKTVKIVQYIGSQTQTVAPGATATVTLTGTYASGSNILSFYNLVAGDALDFIAWRPQAEVLGFSTSFTPTTRAAGQLAYDIIPSSGDFTIHDNISPSINWNDTTTVNGATNENKVEYIFTWGTPLTDGLILKRDRATSKLQLIGTTTLDYVYTFTGKTNVIVDIKISGTTATLFVNGVLIGSVTFVRSSSKTLNLYRDTTYGYIGLYDELLVTPRSASADEILYWYKMNAPFSDSGTIIRGTYIADGEILTRHVSAVGISASVIKGDTLTLGGNGNVNGLLSIKDASGVEVVRGDYTGVTVDGGSYFLKDRTLPVSLVPYSNKILDHSFELVPVTGGDDFTYHDFALGSPMYYWFAQGSPRLYSSRWNDILDILAAHGENCIVINSTNYLYQNRPATAGKTYCASGYCAKGYRSNVNSQARIVINFYDAGMVLLTTTGTNFTLNAANFDWKRVSMSAVAPTNTAYVQTQFLALDANWAYWDGVQLIEGTTPAIYQPNDDVWEHYFSEHVYGNALLLRAYPIGAIYMSVNSTSPATLFGGTWVALGGRFLIGADGTYTAGALGGEVNHGLTIAEMPSHNHPLAGGQFVAFDNNVSGSPSGTTGGSKLFVVSNTGYAGSGTAHNNMPPYLSVYMWKRTA